MVGLVSLLAHQDLMAQQALLFWWQSALLAHKFACVVGFASKTSFVEAASCGAAGVVGPAACFAALTIQEIFLV